jgi:GT2 family glycosyltransferase
VAEPGEPPAADERRVSVVIATRDRRAKLLRALDRLAALPEHPPLIVVDNGSRDGSAAAVRRAHPAAEVVELAENRGAAARNLGAELARTPYVAFSDDDSWWEPEALREAERLLDEHPEIGLLAARILVGPGQRLDPTCATMARSPLTGASTLPGPRVLGFVACGAVVRRKAFLEVGGFERRLGIGGEEELLALELASAGHELAYADRIVAHHHPTGGPRPGRGRNVVRNRLLVTWLRRPALSALRATWCLLARREGARDAALGAADAIRAAGWIRRERRPVGASLERALRALEGR